MTFRSTEAGYAAPSPAAGSSLDNLAARSYDTLLLVGRVGVGLIFVFSGYGKLTGLAAFSASLASRGVPAAWLWGPVGALVEFVGGLLVVFGLGARYAAVLMVLFVIVATLISHRFWEFADPQQFRAQQTQFMKNVCIIGGFVLLFATGGGRWSLDALWRRRRG